MREISIRKKIVPCQLSSEDLSKLAQIVYDPVSKEVIEAEEDWEKNKLPSLLVRIEKHNKDLKQGKSSYFGYTSIPIENPDPFILKEKDNFMSLEKGFKAWNSSFFKIELKDTTIKSDDPEIISSIDEAEKIKSIEYKAVSAGDKYKATINIKNNQPSYYEIEGVEETLVRAVKDKLFDFFETRKFDRSFLHEETFKIISTLILSGSGVFTFYSILNKIQTTHNWLQNSVILWISIFVSIVIFIWLIQIFYRFLDLIYPYVQIENKQSKGFEYGVTISIIVGLLTNLLYELVRFIYTK